MSPASRAARIGYLAFDPATFERTPRLVVVTGKEHVLADEVIAALVKAAVPDETTRALNTDVIDATRAADLAAAVAEKSAALPFLAERRAIVVRGVVELKKEARDALVEACTALPEHAVLIVDHSGKPSRPQGRRLADEAGALLKANKDARLIDCTLKEADCAAYIDRYAPSIGLRIDAGARDALAATEDVAEIKNTLDRLALTHKRVGLKDVAEYAKAPEDAKSWTLAAAVYEGQTERALRLAHEIDDPMGPLIWLTGDAQIIWELAAGARGTDYAAATGQNFWRIRNLFGAAKSRSLRELRDRVDVTMAALERSITGGRDPEQALEEVIVRLAARR